MTADQLAARTPAEAKRHWMIDRLWLGQIYSFVLLAALVLIVWLGGWTGAVEAQRLTWLGMIAMGSLVMQAGTMFAFSLGGPVGRWRATWGNRSLGADDDDAVARAAYDAGPGT